MKKYPIYNISAKWSQDGKHDPSWPNQHKDLPEGRIWNSTSFYKMFKEEKSQKELDQFAEDWYKEMIKNKTNSEYYFPISNPKLNYLKVEFIEYDTWVLTWFEHETFDEGQSDEEALQSFHEYVDRTLCKNKEIEAKYGDNAEKYKYGYKSLMGAEDKWRWRGADEDAPAPCRCKFCKEQGKLRIAH